MENETQKLNEAGNLHKSPVIGSLLTKIYEIDFGGNLKAIIKVTDNKIEIEDAMNGWGDGIPLNDIRIDELQ